MEYKIEEKDGKFYIYKKWFFAWFNMHNYVFYEGPNKFNSRKKAEKYIKKEL